MSKGNNVRVRGKWWHYQFEANGQVYSDGAPEPLAKSGKFLGQHICVPLEGAAVQINAIGCFTRARSLDDIPAAERSLLGQLDLKFAQDLAAHGLASPDRSAHAAVSIVQAALLLRQLARGLHVTHDTARVNGLDITPLGGASLVLEDGIGAFVKDEAYIVSTDAVVRMGNVTLYRGRLALKVGLGHDRVRITEFDTGRVQTIAPFLKLNAGTSTVDFALGKAILGVHIVLPPAFGGVTGDAEVTTDNIRGPELSLVKIAADYFQIFGIGVKHADFTYTSRPLVLAANVSVMLGDNGPGVDASLEFGEDNGDRQLHFHFFTGEYHGPPFINIAPGVDITDVGGGFQLYPPSTVLNANGTIQVGGAPDYRVECPPYKVTGDFNVTFYPGPLAFDAHTAGDLFCQHIVDEYFHVDASGYVHVSANANFDFSVFKLSGNLDVQFDYPHFLAEGSVHGCITDYVCEDGQGVLSDQGIALCYSVKLVVVRIHLGAGFDWPQPEVLVSFTSTIAYILAHAQAFVGDCDFSHYETIHRARGASATAPQTVNVPAGQRAVALAIKGADGVAPDVEIQGPGHAPIVLPASGPLTGVSDAIGFRSSSNGTANLVIARPAAGQWTITPRPGSSAITAIQSAFALPDPSITTTARPRRGGRVTVAYRVKPIVGQKVMFIERVGNASQFLGTARGSSGTLSFMPSSASGTHRSIVAMVTEDGRPRTAITVARFTAPPTRPARPSGLRARRRGGGLQVRWNQAAYAARYIARISLSDGRSLLFFVTARARSFTVPAVARRTTASISVVGLVGRGVAGPAARLSIGHG